MRRISSKFTENLGPLVIVLPVIIWSLLRFDFYIIPNMPPNMVRAAVFLFLFILIGFTHAGCLLKQLTGKETYFFLSGYFLYQEIYTLVLLMFPVFSIKKGPVLHEIFLTTRDVSFLLFNLLLVIFALWKRASWRRVANSFLWAGGAASCKYLFFVVLDPLPMLIFRYVEILEMISLYFILRGAVILLEKSKEYYLSNITLSTGIAESAEEGMQ